MKKTNDWNKFEDGDCYQAGKLTSSERGPSTQLSGALLHRKEFLLNKCTALKDQQQQQDNKYALAFLMSLLLPLPSPQHILLFSEELVLVCEILHILQKIYLIYFICIM